MRLPCASPLSQGGIEGGRTATAKERTGNAEIRAATGRERTVPIRTATGMERSGNAAYRAVPARQDETTHPNTKRQRGANPSRAREEADRKRRNRAVFGLA
jgi:hypothetical protein